MACKRVVKYEDALKCTKCGHNYHYQCLNMPTAKYQSNYVASKKSWRCESCSNVTTRKARNDNTPVRNQYEPLLIDTEMDMSCDLLLHNNSQSAQQTSDSSEATSINLQQFSDLFDAKIEQLRDSMMKAIKATVVTEVKLATEELKNDFTATTDFLAAEQKDITNNINKANNIIKELESQNSQIKMDMKNMERRLNAAEKHSRCLNVEIHAVPERRNENVVELFKKLCEVINFSIADSEIRSCRRVARMNPKSDRPRSILVTLPSERYRDDIISCVRRFNRNNSTDRLSTEHIGLTGDKHLLYVGEHLSSSTKDIHYTVRQFAKDKNYKFVWVKFGKVYLRKDDKSPPILIKDSSCLDKLS